MASSCGVTVPSCEPTSRNHRYSVYPSPFPINDAEPPRRKLKVKHPPFPPPKFWDDLSQKGHIPLTKNALRELKRRNAWRERRGAVRSPLLRRSRRLVARRMVRGYRKPVLPSPLTNTLKRFASHGGPDLADLRGV